MLEEKPIFESVPGRPEWTLSETAQDALRYGDYLTKQLGITGETPAEAVECVIRSGIESRNDGRIRPGSDKWKALDELIAKRDEAIRFAAGLMGAM